MKLLDILSTKILSGLLFCQFISDHSQVLQPQLNLQNAALQPITDWLLKAAQNLTGEPHDHLQTPLQGHTKGQGHMTAQPIGERS